jgi:ribonuclease P protein component
VRNRTKRRLRALVAARIEKVPEGMDVVVRANPAAATASSAELAVELDRLLPRVTGSALAKAASTAVSRAAPAVQP